MIALVTGGSSGLGEAITRRLAQDKSATVYFTYHKSLANAEKIKGELPNTEFIKCDFTNAAEVTALKEKIATLNLDVLVNNAWHGSFLKTHFHKTPPDEFLTEFTETIIPTIAITQSAITSFRKKKSGKIITILTSILLNKPPIGSSIYVANKAYLAQLSKVWATENVAFGITANTVSPEFMLTTFTGDLDERLMEQFKESHPLKKLLTPPEVADAVHFLANATSQINGIDMVINAAVNIK